MAKGLVEVFVELHAADHGWLIGVCGRLTRQELWRDMPGGVSVANLLCHIVEMERFWIDWGLCGESFVRDRQLEFDRRGDLSGEEIARSLTARRVRTQAKVLVVSESELKRPREFHGDVLTGAGILGWHLRHLATHRGQAISHERWLQCERR